MTSLNNNNNNNVQEIAIPDAPADFYCPITCEIMKDPLMSRTGQNFERRAILEWLQEHHNTCPMTRQPLRVSDLYPNRALQSRIHAWCMVHQVPLGSGRTPTSSCHGSDDSDDDDDEYEGNCSKRPEDILITCMISDIIKMPSEKKKNSTSTRRSEEPSSQRRGFPLSRLGRVFSSRR